MSGERVVLDTSVLKDLVADAHPISTTSSSVLKATNFPLKRVCASACSRGACSSR